MVRVPDALWATISAPRASTTAGRSPCGSACASEPPIVPRLRTCWSPMPTRCRRQRGRVGRDVGALGDDAVTRARADHERAAVDADARELGDPADVDERLGSRQPQLERRHERVAAGQRQGAAAHVLERLGDRAGALVGECLGNHQLPAFACWMASHTRPGCIGISRCRMPSPESASTAALTTAARGRDRPRLADALDPERVGGRRRDGARRCPCAATRPPTGSCSRRACPSGSGRSRRRPSPRRAPARSTARCRRAPGPRRSSG